MAGWDRAAAVFLAEAMRVRARIAAMSPHVAVPAVAVLGAGSGVMPDFVTGTATRPGLEVPWAVSANMAHIATHGAEVVHVDDRRGRGDRWGVPQCRGAWGEGDSNCYAQALGVVVVGSLLVELSWRI